MNTLVKKLVSDGSPAMDEYVALKLQNDLCSGCRLPIVGDAKVCSECGTASCNGCDCRCQFIRNSKIADLEYEIAEKAMECEEAQSIVDRIKGDLRCLESELRELKGQK